MNHGSLFSGGGGFDLAANRVGWNNVFNCEIDPFCKRILRHYWPQAETFDDIKKFNAKKYKGKIDIITGGFPCQPFSTAGKRRGTADDRHLWPEMLRVIREIRPRWVVGENVYGFTNWNGGLVFDQVQSDLEHEEYEVWPYILPAAGVNAPHQRYRVFIIAFNKRYGSRRQKYSKAGGLDSAYTAPLGKADTYTNGAGLQGREAARYAPKGGTKANEQPSRSHERSYWESWPTQPALCGRNDGLPAKLDGITISKWRRESIKLFGNAVVPQLVLQIFKAIQLMEAA